MNVFASPVQRRQVSLLITVLFFVFLPAAQAHRTYPGRGAISSQDLHKLLTPAVKGSDAADQVCARYVTGSAVTAPPPAVVQTNPAPEVWRVANTAADTILNLQ